jgi:hypothetical protein
MTWNLRWSKLLRTRNPTRNDQKSEKTRQYSTQNPIQSGSSWPEPDLWPDNLFNQTYLIRPVITRPDTTHLITTSNDRYGFWTRVPKVNVEQFICINRPTGISKKNIICINLGSPIYMTYSKLGPRTQKERYIQITVSPT